MPKITGKLAQYDPELEKNYKDNDIGLAKIMIEEVEKKKRGRPKKTTGEIMKAKTKIEEKSGKRIVDTEMSVKKGLTPKEKKALKSSVKGALDEEIEGSGIRKRGRPKKTTVLDFSDSESDDEKQMKGSGINELKTYGDLLSHLVSHIKDPEEPIDPKDYEQSIKLIKQIEGVKRKVKGKGGSQSKVAQDTSLPPWTQRTPTPIHRSLHFTGMPNQRVVPEENINNEPSRVVGCMDSVLDYLDPDSSRARRRGRPAGTGRKQTLAFLEGVRKIGHQLGAKHPASKYGLNPFDLGYKGGLYLGDKLYKATH